MTPVGIRRIAAVEHFVHDLEEARRFHARVLGLEEIGASSAAHEARARQRSAAFGAGDCLLVCTEPLAADCDAARYLRLHPEGIGAVHFEVEDVERAFVTVSRNGGAPLGPVDSDASCARFALATPLNDVAFTFFQRRSGDALLPGFAQTARAGRSLPSRIQAIDHLTANFQTMLPATLWLERVLGFSPFWNVELHTTGSGLRSTVMWDPRSGVKIAVNEPVPPNFRASQIARFCEEQRGSGVQHVALLVDDIVSAVTELRGRGVRFVATPDEYYRALPARLAESELSIDEDPATLRELQILVDGEGPGRYLLQIFLEPRGTPFFFELIQRKGDPRFGEGNFRALFEGIERSLAAGGA